jgi:protein SCO1
MSPRVMYGLVGLVGLCLGIAAVLTTNTGGPTDPNPMLKDSTALFGQERPLPAFTLTDHNGETYDTERLKGRWTLVFFGYTHCPDVCPTTLSTLALAAKTLRETLDGQSLQMTFVSIDPKRDTQERLAQYVPYFDSEFLGVTGAAAELDKLVSALGAIYVLGTPDSTTGIYTVDHSSRLLLVDPQARFTAILSDRAAPKVLAADLKTILEAYST